MIQQHSGAWVRGTVIAALLAAAVNLLLLAPPITSDPLPRAGVALAAALLLAGVAAHLQRRTAATLLAPPLWWTAAVVALTVAGSAYAARDGVTDAVLAAVTILVAASAAAVIAAGPLTLLLIRQAAAARGIGLPRSPRFLTQQTVGELALDAHRTVTTGSMQVTAAEPLDPEHLNNMLFFAGALARSSDERFAQALARRAGRGRVTGFHATAAGDLTGSVDRHPVRIGRPEPMGLQTVHRGGLRIGVQVDYRALGVITLDDEIRPDAAEVVRRIQQRIPITLLTDTDPSRTQTLADAVGVTSRIAAADSEARRQQVVKAKKDGHLVVFAGESNALNSAALDACDLAITNAAEQAQPREHALTLADLTVGNVARGMELVIDIPGRLRPVRGLALTLSLAGALVGATGLLPLGGAVICSLVTTVAVSGYAAHQARYA